MMRNCPAAPQRQRGAVAITVAIMFVLIVGAAVVYSLDMGSSEVTDASLSNRDLEVRMLAEAGLERAFYKFKNGTACTALGGDGPHSFGGGTFAVTAGALEGANCRVTVDANMGMAATSLTGVTTPGGPTTYSFYEPFPALPPFPAPGSFDEVWIETLKKSKGSTGYSSENCSGGSCAGSSGGSMLMATNTAGKDDQFEGYREHSIPAIDSAVFGTIQFSIAYKKFYSGSKADAQEVELVLAESGSNRTQTLWLDTTKAKDNAWHIATGTANLTPNRSYDRLRVGFKLSENKFDRVWIWVDEISLTSP